MEIKVPHVKKVDLSAKIASNPAWKELVVAASGVMPEVWGRYSENYVADWDVTTEPASSPDFVLHLRSGDYAVEEAMPAKSLSDPFVLRRQLLQMQSRLGQQQFDQHFGRFRDIVRTLDEERENGDED